MLKGILLDFNLVAVLEDLIMGAVNTESGVLRSLIRVFLEHPHTQVKVQEEVDRVVGRNRLASVEDVPK